MDKILLFEITKSSLSLNDFIISINENGESNIIIEGIKYLISINAAKPILKVLSEYYDEFKKMAESQTEKSVTIEESILMTIRKEKEEIRIVDTLLSGDNQRKFRKFIDLFISEIKKNDNKKELLNRNDLANKYYGYHSNNNINDKDKALDYLSNIKEFLNSYSYKNDSNFVMAGRKKFVYDEIINILNGTNVVKDPIYFVLGSLEEFLGDNNSIYTSEPNFIEVRTKNDEYIKSGYICLEEKEYIDNIITKIEEFVQKI